MPNSACSSSFDKLPLFSQLRARHAGILSARHFHCFLERKQIAALDTSATLTLDADHAGGVSALAASPDGRFLLSGSTGSSMKLFDLDKREKRQHTDIGGRRIVRPVHQVGKRDPRAGGRFDRGHLYAISSLAWYPDGSSVCLSAGLDKFVKVWDTSGMDEVISFDLKSKVYSIATAGERTSGSPTFAAALEEGHTRLCDLRSGNFTHILRGHRAAVFSVAFHPRNGFHLVTGSADRTVRLWDIRRGVQCIYALDKHKADDRFLRALGQGPIGSADTLPPQRRPAVPKTQAPPPVAAKQGPQLAGFADESDVWAYMSRVTNKRKRKDKSAEREESNDSQASSSNDPLSRQRINYRLNPHLLKPQPPKSSQSRRAAKTPSSAPSAPTPTPAPPRKPPPPKHTGIAHDGRVTSVRFTTDGQYVLSSGTDGHVRLWDALTGGNCFVHFGQTKNKQSLGTTFAVDTFDDHVFHGVGELVCMFQLKTGRVVRQWRGHLDTVVAVEWNGRRKQVCSGAKDGLIQVFEPSPGFLRGKGADSGVARAAPSVGAAAVATSSARADDEMSEWSDEIW
ncbi:unnamed protein product [Vitrella brassicaformis CCMP3155]|uniref:Anaphase-promoting complex subunit 4 WD40 domain-containing protein n=2 Tax=Vitrella brassicaformis TaxID=1169539 RepID=A0A0G4EGP1_VITBC|nr:unnamed protein product [Vitrella brassicaformis CCMP3155]|eukprot:CEL94633.1 unnamed protein product [Vitrella brassicaformis CCMP3155]